MKTALSFLLIFLIVSCSDEPTSEEIKLVLESDLLTMNNLKFEKNSAIPFTGASLNYQFRRVTKWKNGQWNGIEHYDDDWLIVYSFGSNKNLRYSVNWYSDEEGFLQDEGKRGLHCSTSPTYVYEGVNEKCSFIQIVIRSVVEVEWDRREELVDNTVDVKMCIKEFNDITQENYFQEWIMNKKLSSFEVSQEFRKNHTLNSALKMHSSRWSR